MNFVVIWNKLENIFFFLHPFYSNQVLFLSTITNTITTSITIIIAATISTIVIIIVIVYH